MQWIQHRVNKISELKKLPSRYGAEIDIRASTKEKGALYLAHDPWADGDNFESWLEIYSSVPHDGPLILNTKEDGLEEKLVQLLKRFQVNNYFFLDTALPTLVRFSKKKMGEHFALRYSQYEPIEFAERFSNEVSWLWVDCFDGVPVDARSIARLKQTYRICLVSPELQGAPLDSHIQSFSPLFELADAICTKQPDRWLREFND